MSATDRARAWKTLELSLIAQVEGVPPGSRVQWLGDQLQRVVERDGGYGQSLEFEVTANVLAGVRDYGDAYLAHRPEQLEGWD